MIKMIGALALLALLVQNPVQALEQEEPDIEVVVTATRVEERTDRIPASVSVITAEDLFASGKTTVVEALESVAGVSFRSTSGNASKAEVSMGGFGENAHGRVLVLLDGRRLNRPDMAGINWLQVPLESVERVEVVRGSGSVLYGDHAVGGVINIITKKGAGELAVSASALGGSYGLNQERAGVEGAAGRLSFYADAEHTSAEGYRERSAYRSLGAGVRLGLELGENTAGALSLSYSRLFYQMPGALWKEEMQADPTGAKNPADEATDQVLNIDLGFSAGGGEAWGLEGSLAYGLKFIQTDLTSFASYTDLALHTFALTPRFSLGLPLFGLPSRLTLGSDAYLDLLDLKRFMDKERERKDFEAGISKLSLGAYAQGEIAMLEEALLLSAGLRYDLARISAETLLTAGSEIDAAETHQALVYDLGLVTRPAERARLYVKFTTLFRYPFTDEQASVYGYPSDEFLSDLKPERGTQVEAGGRLRLLEALSLEGRAYLLDMEDEIAFNPATFRNENLDRTRHLGGEVEVKATQAESLELSAGYAFSRAVFSGGANEGHQVPLVPNHRVRLDSTLKLPFELALKACGSYTSDSFVGGDPANAQEKLDGVMLLALSLHYRPSSVPGKLELFVGVDNLLDTRYAETAYYGFDPETYTYRTGYYPSPGRTWKLGGAYRY